MSEKWQPLTLERAPSARTDFGYVIINEWGVWDASLFKTPDAAREYLASHWPRGVPAGFNIVLGKMTVEVQLAPQPHVVRAALETTPHG